MEQNSDNNYNIIARRVLAVAPFLQTRKNPQNQKPYSKLINKIISNNRKVRPSTRQLFAANRKTFNKHALSHAAFAKMSPNSYFDAQIDYDGTLRSIDLEVLNPKHGIGHSMYLAIKRLFDIICGAIGCTLLIPLTIFVKLGNVLTGDFAPVFYHTTRVGKDGEEFNFYKFRSMIRTKNGENAEKLVEQMLEEHPELREQWEKHRKIDNDPRVTKMGKLIRKTSIDEFPQFINILRGDMSMIGPRPLMVGELDEHYGSHETYESVKPGLIGWWAANGRSEIAYNERLQLEYFYVNNQSLALDIKTIFKTAAGMLRGKGAK